MLDTRILACEGTRTDTDTDAEYPCGWEGEVDASIWHGEAHWECPNCGTQNVTDLDPDLTYEG